MTSPKVSVVIPVFNGERFINDALASLRGEREVHTEIIVVDDGSTDGSASAVETLAKQDPRIRLIVGPHRGVSATRNTGLKAATGDMITFLDCDDLCAPDRLTRQVSKLGAHPIAAVIGETLSFQTLTADLTPAPGSPQIRRLRPSLQSALFPRWVFDDYGLFDESLDCCEDIDFFLRLLEGRAQLLIETELGSLYRRHDGNMTLDLQRLKKGMTRAVQRSLVRRRASGRIQPLDSFFMQRFDKEAIFSCGTVPEVDTVNSDTAISQKNQ